MNIQNMNVSDFRAYISKIGAWDKFYESIEGVDGKTFLSEGFNARYYNMEFAFYERIATQTMTPDMIDSILLSSVQIITNDLSEKQKKVLCKPFSAYWSEYARNEKDKADRFTFQGIIWSAIEDYHDRNLKRLGSMIQTVVNNRGKEKMQFPNFHRETNRALSNIIRNVIKAN